MMSSGSACRKNYLLLSFRSKFKHDCSYQSEALYVLTALQGLSTKKKVKKD